NVEQPCILIRQIVDCAGGPLHKERHISSVLSAQEPKGRFAQPALAAFSIPATESPSPERASPPRSARAPLLSRAAPHEIHSPHRGSPPAIAVPPAASPRSGAGPRS